MFLPFLIWGISALVFFIKPGYSKAFEQLKIKTYPLEKQISIPAYIETGKVTVLRTVIGYHILFEANNKPFHLNGLTFEEFAIPNRDSLWLLINDALSYDKARYGKIKLQRGNEFITDTGVKIKFDWKRLTLFQQGSDTRTINFIYKLHYLQFTGNKNIDAAIGIAGIALILTLAILGIFIAFKK